MLLVFSSLLFLGSCGDDDDDATPTPPVVTGGTAIAEPSGAVVDLTFNVVASGGFASATVTASVGVATVTTPLASGGYIR